MKNASRILLACFALLVAGIACAQSAKPTRILFIGNSLTYTTDIPKRLETLANAMGRPTHAESAAFPSYSLEDHWRDGRAMAAIEKGGWDIVVLQQGSSLLARDELIDYAKRFSGPIRRIGAKPALYMVWPLQDRKSEFAGVIESYRAAASAVDGILLPVGEAWLRAFSKQPKARLYSDQIHPSSIGSDLAVLTIYLSIFPAGPQEFTEEYMQKIAKVLEMPREQVDLFFDVATRAIDEPLKFK